MREKRDTLDIRLQTVENTKRNLASGTNFEQGLDFRLLGKWCQTRGKSQCLRELASELGACHQFPAFDRLVYNPGECRFGVTVSVRILPILLIVTAVLEASSPPKPRALSQDRLEKIARRDFLPHDFLFVQKYLYKPGELNRVTIPASVRRESIRSIRTVLRDEWVPTDIGRLLVGLKDVNQFESKDQNGRVITRLITDLAVARYAIGAFRIVVIENGLGVSVKIDLPPGNPIANQRGSVKALLERFLKLDQSSLGDRVWSITSRPGLFSGSVKTKALRPDGPPAYPLHWWDGVDFVSDGSFFFISVADVSGVTGPVCCWPYHPDRF